VFIGPPPEVIRNLGSKVIARKIAQATGVRVIPGHRGARPGSPGRRGGFGVRRDPRLPHHDQGGIGRRRPGDSPGEGPGQFADRTQALAVRGPHVLRDDNIYLEKCVNRPRHVEVQILADSYGNVVHLGTRNCSIQRRHQKLVEIAPAGLAPA